MFQEEAVSRSTRTEQGVDGNTTTTTTTSTEKSKGDTLFPLLTNCVFRWDDF